MRDEYLKEGVNNLLEEIKPYLKDWLSPLDFAKMYGFLFEENKTYFEGTNVDHAKILQLLDLLCTNAFDLDQREDSKIEKWTLLIYELSDYIKDDLDRMQQEEYQKYIDTSETEFDYSSYETETVYISDTEVKINDFITVKFEHNRTNIYVKGKKHIKCFAGY